MLSRWASNHLFHLSSCILQSDICVPQQRQQPNILASIAGSIAIIDEVYTRCDNAVLYDFMSTAGAAAVITLGLFSKQPGLFSYAHSQADVGAFTRSAMIWLEVPRVLVGADELELWQRGALEGNTLYLISPRVIFGNFKHSLEGRSGSLDDDLDRRWANFFTSPLWTVSMRVALPLMALGAAFLASAEAWRRRHATTTCFWICNIQVYVCVSLALFTLLVGCYHHHAVRRANSSGPRFSRARVSANIPHHPLFAKWAL
jgi:hypothetical protein